MLLSADFYNADKTFKSSDEIRRMLNYLGVKPEQQICTYCGGGGAGRGRGLTFPRFLNDTCSPSSLSQRIAAVLQMRPHPALRATLSR